MDNLILIGMPGSGKSTAGVLAAKKTGYAFVDTDLLLQQAKGRLLQDIIDLEGLPYFLESEEELLSSFTASKTVIATGGSAVLSSRAMAHLKSMGSVVYLKVSVPFLETRINNIDSRGIAAPAGTTIDRLNAERCGFYEKYADMVIDCDDLSVEQTAQAIADIIIKQQGQ